MEGARGDTALFGASWRLAWRTAGDALLPAQDQEDILSGAFLGYRYGLARGFVDGFAW